ncbi:MAG: hypothetical protein ACE367_06490 [Acidimicrobiales bacterium]
MNRRPTGSRRLVAIALFTLLVAAGCAQSGAPTTFGEQLGPVGDEIAAALPGVDPDTQMPLAQRNFLEGCITGDTARVEGVSEAERGPGCLCAYDGIVGFYLDNARSNAEEGATAEDIERAAYSAYRELDRDLEDGVTPLPANIQTIVDDCFS